MKTQVTEWEKIFANLTSNNELISIRYKKFRLTNKKTNNPKKGIDL